MRTESPEVPVSVRRQDDTDPWAAHHLNAFERPEVDAALPTTEHFLPPDGVDFGSADKNNLAVRQGGLDGGHPKPAGTRAEPCMTRQAKGLPGVGSSGGNVECQHRRLLSVGAIPGPLLKKTTTPCGFLQAG
jgi:hypothetical protein